MMFHWLRAPQRALHRLLAPALALALAATLVACGGGGYTDSPRTAADRRALPAEFIARNAINYSPYRSSNSEADLNAEVITAANVRQDLLLVRAAGFGVIRLFSSRKFGETVLEVIRTEGIDLKVQLGSFVNPPSTPVAEAENQLELDATIRLANAYSDIVLTVSVGNEKMVYWQPNPIAPPVMARYIRKVRDAVGQPVTTDDNYEFWADAPKIILDEVDYAAVHTYALLDTFYVRGGLWDWRQKEAAEAERAVKMADAAIAEARRQVGKVRTFFDRIGLAKLPIIIGETGWTAVDTDGGPVLKFRAHPVNQKLYLDRLRAWAEEGRSGDGPKAVFVFQAFDEKWKQGDDGWGLFNKDRQARYAIQAAGTCGTTWVCEPGSYTDADAVKWVLPEFKDAVDADRYTIFSEAAVPSGQTELRPTGLRTDAFGPATATGEPAPSTNAAPNDGTSVFRITPTPANYGWGLFYRDGSDATENLGEFADGAVKFWVRSTYPGKIEIGLTSDNEDRDGAEVFLQIGSGDYGYCNNGSWCEVSIPLKAFTDANPKLDLRLVLFRFVIADRFEFTGKPLNTTGLPPIELDGIRWER
jgi:exo-beta-1,3-glucanase (GH17 family)